MKEDLFSSNQFSNLNLSPHLSDCLEKRFKLKKMTQIQEKSIPAILAGNDHLVLAVGRDYRAHLLLAAISAGLDHLREKETKTIKNN